jgi:C4-dicarboxylate transporter DctM subunit
MNFDLVWFGIITVIAVEVGLITPPLGIAAYVVKSTLDDQSITLNDLFAGAFPYVLIMIVVLVLVVIFPQISLVLVR